MITLENFTLRRGKRLLVSDINCRFERGVHIILGSNGAGKTSLLRFLSTIDHHQRSGNASILGRDLFDKSDRKMIRPKLGYVPQLLNVPPPFLVSQLVEYVAILKGVNSNERKAKVETALRISGSLELSNRKVNELSGGERQRANIAQALVNEPRVLLLDEPTAGLDPGAATRFRRDIYDLAANICIVITTHLEADILDDVSSVSSIESNSFITKIVHEDFLKRKDSFGYEGGSVR